MRWNNRLLLLLVLIVVGTGVVAGIGYAGGVFSDDDGSVFAADIEWIASEGIARGCNPPANTEFCPDAYVTRGQMAAFLHRALSQPLVIHTAYLASGTVGKPYVATLSASGGVPPYMWSVSAGALPAGLDLDSSGQITGVPTTEEVAGFTVRLTDVRGTATEAQFEIEVIPAGRIAFIRDHDVCIVNPDGSDYECITGTEGVEWEVARSPDGKHIAFTSYRYGRKDIYLVNEDGSGLVALTSASANDWDPAFSPDGSKIAFARGPYDGEDIWVMNTDGSGLQQLTNDAMTNRSPTWSPDGDSIAYRTWREGYRFEIYVMDADGENPRPVTLHPAMDNNPDWSPDGSLIAFEASRGVGCNAVFIMNADGSDQHFVACGFEPTFSPDGTEIAYSRSRTDIFVMSVDGSDARCVACDSAGEESPDWN